MPDFNQYFMMTPADAAAYLVQKGAYFPSDAVLEAQEIGDGNMNYVFRVRDTNSGRSLILKQAGPCSRLSDEFKVPTYRNRIESELLAIQHELSPGLVPAVYFHDPVMHCFAMDDLSDHVILRRALSRQERFPRLADDLSTYLANSLLLTSDVVLDHKKKKEFVHQFHNPILAEITEDLVLTEPFYDCPRNDVFAPVQGLARREIWEDPALQLESARLKFAFMTHTQSLLHGDLHTGSIFVRQDSTKVFDCEFIVVGPAGFDVGLLLANFVFAYARADATVADAQERETFKQWMTGVIVDTVRLFFEKLNALWDTRATERTASYPGFREQYFAGILSDAAGYMGCELIRRVIGIAHVADLTEIKEPRARTRAETLCLLAGKALVLSRGSIRSGEDLAAILKKTEARLSSVAPADTAHPTEDRGVNG